MKFGCGTRGLHSCSLPTRLSILIGGVHVRETDVTIETEGRGLYKSLI